MKARAIPVLAALLALGLAGCGGGEETTTAAQPPPPPPTAEQPPPPTPPPAPEVTTVSIVVRGGKVVGGIARPQVKQGDRVAIVVRSDDTGALHLHGYEKAVDITPAAPARIAFVASIPGRFEVEMHGDRHFQIADIEVRP